MLLRVNIELWLRMLEFTRKKLNKVKEKLYGYLCLWKRKEFLFVSIYRLINGIAWRVVKEEGYVGSIDVIQSFPWKWETGNQH
jgi:hypothetical protein